MLLDSEEGSSNSDRMLVQTIAGLAKMSGTYPDCICLAEIERFGDHPMTGGGFADIWKGTLMNCPVALKALRVFNNDSSKKKEMVLKDFAHEAVIWRQLRHKNILPFYGIFKGNPTFDRLCLVSPWMNAGNVVSFLKRFPDSDRISLLGDVVDGLRYLHEFEPTVVHGDLKGSNIFVTPSQTACLADFGLTRFRDPQYSSGESTTESLRGTIRWQARELLIPGNNGKIARPSRESDIYSFGCVCLEIMTGNVPFSELTDVAVTFAIMQNKKPQRPVGNCTEYGLDDSLWNTIESCWDNEPSQRPTVVQLGQYFSQCGRTPTSGSSDLDGCLQTPSSSLATYGFSGNYLSKQVCGWYRNRLQFYPRPKKAHSPLVPGFHENGTIVVNVGERDGIKETSQFAIYESIAFSESSTPLCCLVVNSLTWTSSTLGPLDVSRSYDIPPQFYASEISEKMVQVYCSEQYKQVPMLREALSDAQILSLEAAGIIFFQSDNSAQLRVNIQGDRVILYREDDYLASFAGYRISHTISDDNAGVVLQALGAARHFHHYLEMTPDIPITIELRKYQFRKEPPSSWGGVGVSGVTPVGPNLIDGSKTVMVLESDADFGATIYNHTNLTLYAYLFSFDCTGFIISRWLDVGSSYNHPLLLPESNIFIGYDAFHLPWGESNGIGFIKLYLTTSPTDLPWIFETSAFENSSIDDLHLPPDIWGSKLVTVFMRDSSRLAEGD
ncbi:kinase-like protein [Rickenella mellea]|uniref:Kinase-like protein n=1 Tax=Rickenella mellea TaxID=50990 RepID=A0A4Y7PKR9_9AGAM|nr:kinase-like protein [Rickenella mellea]